MTARRRTLNSSNSRFNFRPNTETSKWETDGKKQLPEPTAAKQVNTCLMMIVHMLRKILLIDANLKLGIYGGSLFIVSLLTDALSFQKTCLSRSDNIFNQYFVKLGWAWTLLVISPFLLMTSYTYCCGKRCQVLRHFARLAIATVAWYGWTQMFCYIERLHGLCNILPGMFRTTGACVAGRYFSNALDISGHTFILTYSILVLIEEARPIVGWEYIRDIIRDEERARIFGDGSVTNAPLHGLSFEDLSSLKKSYEKFTPYIQLCFIAMALLCVLWDVMLVSTILYYHTMTEKLIGGAIAVLTWFFTYGYWYAMPQTLPKLPGDGLFKYTDV
jgi:hypothetical protein